MLFMGLSISMAATYAGRWEGFDVANHVANIE
jgi:hypothetical protein